MIRLRLTVSTGGQGIRLRPKSMPRQAVDWRTDTGNRPQHPPGKPSGRRGDLLDRTQAALNPADRFASNGGIDHRFVQLHAICVTIPCFTMMKIPPMFKN